MDGWPRPTRCPSVCLSGNWHLAESIRRFDSRSITQSAGESVRSVLGSTLVLVLGLAKRGCHAHLLKYLPDTFAQLDSRLLAAASALALALQLQLSTLPSYFVCLALFACLFGLVAVILQLGCPLAAVAVVVVVAGRTSLVIVFAFCLFAVANDEIELMRPALKASSAAATAAAAAAAGAEQTLQTPVETVETLCTAHPKSNTPQSSMDRNRFTVDSLH